MKVSLTDASGRLTNPAAEPEAGDTANQKPCRAALSTAAASRGSKAARSQDFLSDDDCRPV